jgi:protein-S-isoprenylcysteine O-methyltransferase Ste14
MVAEAGAQGKPRLGRSGITRVATVLLALVLQAAIFFVAAGTTDIARAWVYYGTLLVYFLIAMPVLFVRFPQVLEVVNERGKFKADTKTWDKVWGIAYTALLLVIPGVAGYDVGHGGAELSAVLLVPSLVITIAAYAFAQWAMVVNPYAETGARVQADRGQHVVDTGPYRFVRHPFYVSIILMQLVYPTALGSTLAFAPVAVLLVTVVWRTAMEDRMLHAELAGYAAYSERTRYRLLPGVW